MSKAGPKGCRRSLKSGFDNALSAIADSNITTLLAAGLLFFLAAGPVRGFGVTLSIGVIASMLSALVVSGCCANCWWRASSSRRRPGHHRTGRSRPGTPMAGAPPPGDHEAQPPVAARSRWSPSSVSLAGIVVRGGLNLGVEFTGGRLIEVSTNQPVTSTPRGPRCPTPGFPARRRPGVRRRRHHRPHQEIDDDEAQQIRDALGRVGGGIEPIRDEKIGPSLGNELRNKALIALGVALGSTAGLPGGAVPLDVRRRCRAGAAAERRSSCSASSPGWTSRSTASSWPRC